MLSLEAIMLNLDDEKFIREKDLVERLMLRLGLGCRALTNPNSDGKETGIDILVALTDCRNIGVQVTVLDPHSKSGKARAREKRIAGKTPIVYGDWAQNDPQIYLKSLVSAIKRKIAIAERHTFEGLSLTEVWLLVCAGTPEYGAVASSMIMTPWLRADEIESVIGDELQKSKYDRCFLFPILGAERAFYTWEKQGAWKKAVSLEDIREVPRESYLNGLMLAAAAGDEQEMDRLLEEEVRAVLHEMRETKS
jgi:hypothetical protein